MERPDKNAALSALRGFQRQTVDHVVSRLLDAGGSQRFLVADEVGLGKTLVARGVIAEFIDKHWGERRIDIVYVCSNSALAKENLAKLRARDARLGREISATRLTLLASKNDDRGQLDAKLNFISLTPNTAIKIRGTGIAEERHVLFVLLRQMQSQLGEGIWLTNFLQGGSTKERWRERLRLACDVDEGLAERFCARLRAQPDLLAELSFMSDAFSRTDSVAARDASAQATRLIGKLRNLLAGVCIDALEPDLIILDEFQRFKSLLGTEDEVNQETELAQQLFSYRTPEQSKVALLLLSATPYRMFTTNDETATEDHHADFLETVRFLLDDEVKFERLRAALADHRQELLRAARGQAHELPSIRAVLEGQLLQVMSRRERVGSTDERDAMVTEPKILAPIESVDVAQYLGVAAVGEQLEARDLGELWKSAPYLLNFGKQYEFKRHLEERRRDAGVRKAVADTQHLLLSPHQLRDYEAVDPANGRLRALAREVLEQDRWRMLWLPPSLPYWPLEGPWKGNEGFTKQLVFSAWNVVPDAVSALLSYEVERRMAAGGARQRNVSYDAFYGRRTELLRFTARGGIPRGMTTLGLQLPCLRLADVHPLELVGSDVREAMKLRLAPLLEELRAHAGDGPPDRAWYWAASLFLDDAGEMEEFLVQLAAGEEGGGDALVPNEEAEGSHGDSQAEEDELSVEDASVADDAAPTEAPRRGRKGLRLHVERALEVLRKERSMGALPEDLIEVLAEHALGNPAVLWARTLRNFGVPDSQRRSLAGQLAEGFRSLFNEPPVVEMLHRGEEEAYWRTTLDIAIQGNLQAVLDEYAHQLWEAEKLKHGSVDAVAAGVTQVAVAAMTTKTSRVVPDYIETRPLSLNLVKDGLSVRTHFALRYGSLHAGGDKAEAREETVRDAFKSPFYPFVLLSTSVGQEGLDFHPWCHAVWHWNLPGNPVDLEQREGRVHRYKGHAVRKNIAERHGRALREAWSPGCDPWDMLFDQADHEARVRGDSPLVPCWLAPGSAKVRRCVPMLPFSRELEKLEHLKRSLAIYRVVFGQPRQEELLKLLHRGEVSQEELDSWVVRLEVGAPKVDNTCGAPQAPLDAEGEP